MSPGKAKKTNGAQSIERAMAVLRAVAAAKSNGSTLSQVVTASRLNKATVHRLLAVLAREGLVERNDETKTYHLGEQLYALGILAAPRFGLHQLAMPGLRRLAALSEDSSFLCLLSGNDVVCVHREEGSHPIRTHVMQVGIRWPLGVGSFGPVMLAAMDDAEVERILAVNRRAIEAYENYSIERIRQLVKTARAKGYSVNPGLVYTESYGIAVAVLDERDQPVGALSIGAVASRLQADRQPKLAAALKSEAAALSEQLRKMRSRISP
jgi:DNA-binding IclR family transcriptional regulator